MNRRNDPEIPGGAASPDGPGPSGDSRLTPRIIFIIVLCDLAETVIVFCFKKIMMPFHAHALGSFDELFAFAWRSLHSPYPWTVLLCMVIAFVSWSNVLADINLSVAYPLASLSFLFVPVISIFFLSEQVPFLRWVGIASISAGITLLSFVAPPPSQKNE